MTQKPARLPLPRTRHLALAAALAVVVAVPIGVTVAGPTMSAAARPTPVRTSDVKVHAREAVPRDLGGQLPATARAGAITDVHRVAGGLAVVGATWAEGALSAGDRLELRTRRDGVWQPWEPMAVDDAEHGPDPDTAEGRASRAGTAPVVVEGDASQVRIVTSRTVAPAVDVTFVDPGTSTADASVGASAAGSASAAAARPTIYTRKDWGADESLRRGTPRYGQVQVGFVHHTVGTNSYSAAQVPAIIRGIYDFHVNGRGWNDVGYQFLVDRFGRVWEGRAGGVDKAVEGAQAGGYNSSTFGASVMGDFTSAAVPSAVTDALARLFAWKFALHGIPVTGTVAVNDRTFNRVSGHRDANVTSCPGSQLYVKLPALRTAVAARIGSRSPSTLRRSVDTGGTPDLFSLPGGNGLATNGQVMRSASTQPVLAGVRISGGWGSLSHIVLSQDLTGDGLADVVAVVPATGSLRIARGNGLGGVSGVTTRGSGWNAMTRLVAAGDRTGDKRADLLAVRNDGSLVLYEGDGAGWLRAGRVVGTGFGAFRSVTDAGDVTGDGRRDLLTVRTSTNVLELHPGRADGGIDAPVAWGTGWQGLTEITAADLDRDGRAGDVLVRQADGRMRAYYADATGRLTRMNTFGKGWGALDALTTGADWNGDGVADLLARVVATGDLRLYAGTGERDFSRTALSLITGLADANLVRLVGDVDGDGLSDAVARTTAGDLIGLRGRGDGRFDRLPARIGSGWQIFDLIEAVGDYTNDGIPDLVARTSAGELRVYALTASLTVGWSLPIGTGWQGARSITATGAVNADVNADVVVLRTDGSVRLYRGSGPGALIDYDVVLTGQKDLVRIIGTGDLTGDGPNDILGQTADGRLFVYPGDGSGGFRASRQPVRSPSEVGRVLS